MTLKSKVGEQEVTVEITQDHAIKIALNGKSIGDLLENKEILSDNLGFLLRLTFRITEIK